MISAVVPVFNEQESLLTLYKELVKEIRALTNDYEIIIIDDGSSDASLEVLKKLEKKDERVRIFSFRRNQGKAEALTLGFQKANGDVIVTLDADLQDKPSEIAKLVKKLDGGWDLVCGWRRERKDPFLKVVSSKMFNLLARTFWGVLLHDYNCGLKAYRKEAAKSLSLYGGMHRFIPLILHQKGFTVTEIPVVHEKRKFGKSKYGISKLWKDLPDIFTMIFLSRYSQRPLHFFGTIGGALFLTGLITLSYLSILHFLGESIGRRPLLFLGMLLVISGFQLFFTGFLADLITNLFRNGRSKDNLVNDQLLKYSSSK